MSVKKKSYLPISQQNPRSPITEAYRTIRTNLQFSSVLKETRLVLITSSISGEGKTSTTANLGVVCAESGQRVLLIDADLRKPQLHNEFRLSNLTGLSSILIKEKSLSECIQETLTPNLFVLPCGPIPPNPAEALSSPAFEQVLMNCSEQFDLIFLDSPPILAVTDPLLLTKYADGILFVINAQSTNRNIAIRAKGALEQVNARVLGVILNKIPKRDNRNYGNYAPYYFTELKDDSIT